MYPSSQITHCTLTSCISPNLIPSSQTMQTLLDSTLVLTKQDRLCHVVHATSDPFYQGWLSRVGVLWYCKLISIGDLSKPEMRAYFRERVLPRLECLPPSARRLDFETLYDAFGGKVAHWYDYITDYGKIEFRPNLNSLLTIAASELWRDSGQ